jgi:hypothetical protein
MKQLTISEFIEKIMESDEFQIIQGQEIGAVILQTRKYIPDTVVAHEEQFTGPNPVDVSSDEYMAFMVAIQDLLTGAKRAEPQPDATSGESRKETTERQYFERWRRNWEDENSDGVLRDPSALGEAVRHHDGEEAG